MLALFLWVLALTQFGALHHEVCSDADQPDHTCAATLLAGGQVELALSHVSVEYGGGVASSLFPVYERPQGLVACQLPPCRAPPEILP